MQWIHLLAFTCIIIASLIASSHITVTFDFDFDVATSTENIHRNIHRNRTLFHRISTKSLSLMSNKSQ